ncbi:hypothetical protein AAG570_000537 [Ranatra chinensis]|uniref:Palmitoyltransferase n=1 Tax=Ranatra chinensis TaxID=642074 RepID=A0ABD0Z7Q7_9HEMI
MTPVEQRRWRRVHGLQRPLHPQQVLGWLLVALFASLTFSLLVPTLPAPFRPPLFALLAVLFIVHAAAHLTALLLDPADVELRKIKTSSAVVPEFDRTRHAHVIENGRCHLCNIETSGPRTKHCSVCNKCVGGFDHHCKWLNHCIGSRNYAVFLVCVVSAVLACFVIVALSVTVLVLYHTDRSRLAAWHYSPFDGSEYEPYSVNVFALDDRVFQLLVVVQGVLAAVAAGLLTHLCLFHAYISFRGITTYEYIRNYRRAASEAKRSSAPPSSDSSEPVFTVQSDYALNRPIAAIKRGGASVDAYCSRKEEISYVEKSTTSSPEEESGAGRPGRGCWRFLLPNRRRKAVINPDVKTKSESRDTFSTTISTPGSDQCSYQKLPPLKRTDTFRAEVTPLAPGELETSGRTPQNALVVRKSCPGCRYCKMLKADPTLKEQIDAYKRKSARRKLKRKSGSRWFRGVCAQPTGRGTPPVKRNRVLPAGGPLPGSKSAGDLQSSTVVPLKEPRRSLPALPPPARRHPRGVSLGELSEVLAAVQRPRPRAPRHPPRRHSPMSPTLSPIHESGLSNPSTPHLADRAPRPRQALWLPPLARISH